MATIKFSEPLAKQLTNSNLSVFVNSVAQDFSITMIDEYNWLIEPVYLEDVSENSIIEIFLLGDMVSKNNSLFSSSRLISNLYPLKSQILANQLLVEQLAAVKKTAQQVAIAIGTVLGSVTLLNFNLIFLFQFLNAAEMFALIQYFNMDLDPLFLKFISTLQISFKFPSIFDYFVDNSDRVTIPTKYQNIGFDTNLIMINSGANLTIFVVILTVLLILFTSK